MLHENIKHLRKAKGLSQEEIAVRLHVVRQTVSKWENGRSVPSADELIILADVLGVSVEHLLDLSPSTPADNKLARELACATNALAQQNLQMKLLQEAARKRGLILLFSFLSMTASIA